MVPKDVRDLAEKYLDIFRSKVRMVFIISLVLIHLFSDTKLFQWLKTVAIFFTSFVFFLLIAILIGNEPEKKPDYGLTIFEFCQKYGYNLKNETVITEDGYILTMHRLQCGRNQTKCNKKRPPVLVMHGLVGSSTDYVALGPSQALAFQLADKGYDVWLGNNRGTSYSRKHVMLDPDIDSLFWDFSYDQIGLIDLPAMIDHIIKNTNYSRVTYIGMSQGSVSYLALTSSKPEYNDKIVLANLLAPVTTLYNTKNVVFRVLAFWNFILEPFLNYVGPLEVLGDTCLETMVVRNLCVGPHKIANWFCTEIIIKFFTGASDSLDYNMVPFFMGLTPAGASTKQFQHFIQTRISGNFSKYNYYSNNEARYGMTYPPVYNLSKITAPLAVYYSRGDVYSNIERLYFELKPVPNVVLTYKVPDDNFNHLDFIYAKDINVQVYNKLLEMIDKYNKVA